MKTIRRPFQIPVRISVILAVLLPAALVGGGPAVRADSYFPQTGYSIWGPFESYWQAALVGWLSSACLAHRCMAQGRIMTHSGSSGRCLHITLPSPIPTRSSFNPAWQ